MSNSVYQANASEGGGVADLQGSQAGAGKYRTDSAAKPFALKKPPLHQARVGSGRTQDYGNRSYMLPQLQQNDSFS